MVDRRYGKREMLRRAAEVDKRKGDGFCGLREWERVGRQYGRREMIRRAAELNK